MKDANTWSGADGSGRRPETSLKGDRPLEDAKMMPSSVGLMGWVQAHAGRPESGLISSTADVTPGRSATFGTGRTAYSSLS